jgi:lipopolysaccharide transport system ATP-binding protein
MNVRAAAISVEGIGKRYRILHERQTYGRLTDSLSGAIRAPLAFLRGERALEAKWLSALVGVSFEVPHGEVFGVIGRNGAGKSTLLKILSRITEPTTGRAVLRGRVGSLLEVGSGFHPELTGRENVYLSGAVMGMRRSQIRRLFDEIVAFAGVEEFLDTPVKRYSTGMQVRLGFAVAAHLESEILIVDEVLAVGDAEFQRKCIAKMEDAAQGGRTVLFVSHNMPAVESLCTRAILLEHGRLTTTGAARDVVGSYLKGVETAAAMDLADRTDRQGDGRLRITKVTSALRTGAPSEIRVVYEGSANLRNIAISLGLFTLRREGAIYLASEVTGDSFVTVPSRGTFVCRLDRAALLPGRYALSVYCTVNGELADWVTDAAAVDVSDGDFFGSGKLPPPHYGSVTTPHRWTVESSGG